MEQHVTILNPAVLIECSECGRGNFCFSDDSHPTGGAIWHCTWGGCASEGVTMADISLDEGEQLELILTEAGLCLGYRVVEEEDEL